VLPGEKFDYRFIAEPAGTHTWHAHHGVERVSGLFGALIVNEKKPTKSSAAKPPLSTRETLCGDGPSELLVLSVWQHEDSESLYIKRDGPGWFPHGPSESPYQWTRDTSGKLVGEVPFRSGLINGRGRFGNESKLALTEFEIAPSTRKCFRVIASMEGKALRVSIDQHALTAFASDGMDFTPMEVESIIVHPGETVDFSIASSTLDSALGRSGGAATVWIRAETLEVTGGDLATDLSSDLSEGGAGHEGGGSMGVPKRLFQSTQEWVNGNTDAVTHQSVHAAFAILGYS